MKGQIIQKQKQYLKNNGKEAWPKGNAKLLFERNSKLIGDEISLEPQKPGEEKKYYALFKNLGNYPAGEYKSFLSFYVDDKIFGDKLSLRINIKKKDKGNDEINEYIDKIKEFRETFSLSETDFNNETLLEVLKDNDFDFESSFQSLFS